MKYAVMLRGENFELNYEGQIKNFGFVTTRIVKSPDAKTAELNAIDLIKNDSSLIDIMIDEPQLEAKIYLEEISEAKWWKRVGGAGYTFFDMAAE